MVKNYVVLILSLIFLVGCSYMGVLDDSIGSVGGVVRDIKPVEQSGGIDVYFCPEDSCEQALIDVIDSSKEYIHCAFFDIDIRRLIKLLGDKSKSIDVKLVVDNENYGEIKGPGVKMDTSSQYSHNKFCVVDDSIVVTGSMNPTDNGAHKNNNNLLVIYSKYLVRNYGDEFDELWAGEFGSGDNVLYPVIYLNGDKIENYFCPEDFCASRIIEAINNAEESVYFMTFSFTHEGIADAMLFNDDIEIKGLFEKRGSGSKYSQYNRLRGFGLDVRLDTNGFTMHHKVFIIDNRTVITGSMNPSSNANRNNDENILIIHDSEIASKYVEEFFRLY